ncbi:MAG UNVERIFIED_CONTAM: phage head closure protein [Rickettsiaceae bacterium]|jgi:SPP1 family predicted phage head-tail adaptor
MLNIVCHKNYEKNMAYITASNLDHEITFLENITASQIDEENWVEKYRCYANIRPMYDNNFGSIESFSFGHIVTEAYFMFKIRYSLEVTDKMRIKFNDRIFEIKRIINIGEGNRVLQIITLEM